MNGHRTHRHKSKQRWIAQLLCLAFVAGANVSFTRADELPNRVAAGDVTATTAMLWARASVAGEMRFEISDDADFATIDQTLTTIVTDPMVPAKVEVDGLVAGTRCVYRATDAADNTSRGTFRTPAIAGRHGLHFGVSGDWRGDLAPYLSIRNVPDSDLDLFIALGDTIYADVPSPDVPLAQAQTLAEFRTKYDEVYSTRAGRNDLGALRASTAWLATIDDHEVTNDFAGAAPIGSDPRFDDSGDLLSETNLFSNGLRAFVEYNPIQETIYEETGDPRFDGKHKLYRARYYGSDAAFFLLDARTFRDEPLDELRGSEPQAEIDQFLSDAFNPDRTMLGATQFDDLLEDLIAAHLAGFTWKFVIIPEPIQNLSPILASDRYEGYAHERTRLLRFIEDHAILNVVFIAADIHGTMVNNLTFQDGPGEPQQITHAFEVTTGPVAYAAPFGPTVVDQIDPVAFGFAAEVFKYVFLGAGPTLRDSLVALVGNFLLDSYSYDAAGLDGSPIDARLESGGYVAVNYYGWSEFEIDAVTQRLTITTWGIDWYSAEELATDAANVLAREPRVVNRFSVMPDCSQLDDPCFDTSGACGAMGIVIWAWIPLGLGMRFAQRRHGAAPRRTMRRA